MKIFKPLLVAASVFVLAACSFSPTAHTVENEPVINLRNTNTQYAFAAYTGIRMLEEIGVVSTPQALRQADEEDTADDELEIVNRYLNLYKELTEEGVLDVAMAEVSDRPEYVFQITITTTDIDKVQSTFVLYFNEVVIEDETEVDDDIDDTGETTIVEEEVEESDHSGNYRHREDPRSDDESTLLEGIVVIGEEEFIVRGYRLVDEDEIRFGFRAQADDGRVLRISHLSEENTQRFHYFLRNHNVLITEKKVMIKVEDNATILKLEERAGQVREKYSFRQEATDDGVYYKIRFMTPEGKGTIHIYVTVDDLGQEVLEYFFSGGNAYHHDGGGNHHGEHGGDGHGGNGHRGDDPEQEDDEDYEEDFGDLDEI
ncbi:MAG: hypothetical protein WC344_02895 [Bacilli bacterium]|jgi:hypothetical protein